MCEYCGCQALTAIAELTWEHDEVVALISRVRAAHTAGDVAGLDTADWDAIDAIRDRVGTSRRGREHTA
jgi:hypothetical protein